MQKANMLAGQINEFIKFVLKNYENKNSYRSNTDKLYQVKLLIDEFQFQIIADELWRINQYSWEEKYTHLLVERFKKGFTVIDEYVKNNYNDLYILSARLYTLNNLSMAFSKR